MWWAVLLVGAVGVLLPGMLNPFAPFNGLTLLGLIVVVWAANRIANERIWK